MIEHLEQEALPMVRYLLEPAPRKASVRAALAKRRRHLQAARDSLAWLTGYDARDPVRVGAFRFIPGGGTSYLLDGVRLGAALRALDEALAILDEALARIGREPVRHRQAASEPVKHLYLAIQHGAARATGDPDVPALRPSASPTSRFYSIVCICYAAAGMTRGEPERAIKAYVRRWRQVAPDLALSPTRTERPAR